MTCMPLPPDMASCPSVLSAWHGVTSLTAVARQPFAGGVPRTQIINPPDSELSHRGCELTRTDTENGSLKQHGGKR